MVLHRDTPRLAEPIHYTTVSQHSAHDKQAVSGVASLFRATVYATCGHLPCRPLIVRGLGSKTQCGMFVKGRVSNDLGNPFRKVLPSSANALTESLSFWNSFPIVSWGATHTFYIPISLHCSTNTCICKIAVHSSCERTIGSKEIE